MGMYHGVLCVCCCSYLLIKLLGRYPMCCLAQVLVSAVLSLYVVRLAQREFTKMSQESTEKPQVVVL